MYYLYKIIIKILRELHLLFILDDKKYLKMYYYVLMKKKLKIDNPVTFNEKLQWLKLFDRKRIYSVMVDKYEAKQYVSNIIGKEYIIPTLGIYEKFNDINFDELPKRFVIKCTHDSGGIIIVKDKHNCDLKNIKKKLKKCLKRNYYYNAREWPYKLVKPRILIERYMVDESEKELKDYKFFCFNGKVKFFKIDFDRFIEHHANYYDTQLNLLPFGEVICMPDNKKNIVFPKNIKEMIDLAERLAKNIPFVRVDFYNVNDNIYFGEMTFYPAAGFGKFEPDEWDKKIGDMLQLPEFKNRGEK